MITFKFTYYDVINLITLLIECELNIKKKKHSCLFFTDYTKFNLDDLLYIIISFIYDCTDIELTINVRENIPVTRVELDIIEDSINILLNKLERM